jgi:hypothetical protein
MSDDAQLQRLLCEAMELQAEGKLGEGYARLREWLRIRVRRGDPGGASVPARRVPISRTTLVCVDCRDYDLAAAALTHCLERCSFERAKWFTDNPEARADGVQTVRIPKITSTDAYSRFVMKELDQHVDTEFALLVQYDGYILNAGCWSEEFLDYDYIGARWPAEDWITVGNGGFSLRSKRLLRALQDPAIEPADPEDVAICRTYRERLEDQHGIRFAPDDVAARFSFETVPSDGPTLGFHGLGHLVNLYDKTDAEVAAYRPPPFDVRPR